MRTETLWDIAETGMNISIYCGVPAIIQFFATGLLGLAVGLDWLLLIGAIGAFFGVLTFVFGILVYNVFSWLASRKRPRRIA